MDENGLLRSAADFDNCKKMNFKKMIVIRSAAVDEKNDVWKTAPIRDWLHFSGLSNYLHQKAHEMALFSSQKRQEMAVERHRQQL